MAVARPPGSRRVFLQLEGDRQSISLGYVTDRGADLIDLLRQWAAREEQHLAPTEGAAPPPPEPEDNR